MSDSEEEEDYAYDSDSGADAEGYEYVSDSDDEYAGCGASSAAPTPAVPSLARQASHEVMTAEEAARAMREMVARVADECGLARPAVALVLRELRWDERAMVRRFREAELDELLEASGASGGGGDCAYDEAGDGAVARYAGGGGGGGDATFTCFVCFEEVARSAGLALACGHVFCAGCWRDGLGSAVDTGGNAARGVLSTTCFMPDCALLVPAPVFRAVLSHTRMEAYQRLQALSFVDDNPAAAWCPHPGCGGVVFGQGGRSRRRNVRCGSGHGFCFACGGAAHAPTSCEEHHVWCEHVEKQQKDGGGGLSAKFVKDVKLCPNPKCRVKTTKESGCMYLDCSRCSCHWCWQCGDWGGVDGRPNPHHVYDCNRPPDGAWLEGAARSFANDARFQFYRERSDNHRASLRFAEEQREAATAMYAEVVKLLEQRAGGVGALAVLDFGGSGGAAAAAAAASGGGAGAAAAAGVGKKKEGAAAGGSGKAGAKGGAEEWVCATCTYTNTCSGGATPDALCDMCGTKRWVVVGLRHQKKKKKKTGAGPEPAQALEQPGSTARCAEMAYEQLHLFRNGNMILEAAGTLIKCREVLVWTYIWAFFEADAGVRTLFEYCQKDLETFTEQLSELIEGKPPAFVAQHSQRIVALNTALQRFLSAMLYYERPGGERESLAEQDAKVAVAAAAAAAAAGGAGPRMDGAARAQAAEVEARGLGGRGATAALFFAPEPDLTDDM